MFGAAKGGVWEVKGAQAAPAPTIPEGFA